ncbi:helix-turn-helix domain-containing protein [Novosphingobium huizhouense]|uniref:helix-turn-helix domain-containing protein n=1 Tax=Novosphingobium huizhouense TaxID=2866625 RepID=UPI001CD8C82A|nr:helix-turn-helix transcriptional regulator [Novosphingobium huizhouense]
MTIPDPAAPALDASLDALTEREREILRLLAGGHTVKSIAAELGRSEASINERLRDARRKTGVGSSRELARLLEARCAAQKNRDEKIDLPRHGDSVDERCRPPSPRRRRSKGSIAMFVLLPVAAFGGLLTLAGQPWHAATPEPATVGAAAGGPSPLAGRWSLDVARIPAEERPQHVTISFATAADRSWTTEVEFVAPDGSVRTARSVARTDGVPVPVRGTFAAIDSASLRQPAPDTLVMTLGKDGRPVSTRVYAVAPDRRTMTETIVWAGQALPRLETTVFTRID